MKKLQRQLRRVIDNDFAGLTIESWEDQVVDLVKWSYHSPSQISEAFFAWGENWARKARACEFIPYYDEMGFVRWKQLRTDNRGTNRNISGHPSEDKGEVQ